MQRRRKNSRKISNDFWNKVEPLLPEKKRPSGIHYRRAPGAGRKSIPARQALEAILYVLRSGIPWKNLPKHYGSASAVHRRFRQWYDAGLFTKLWMAGLAEDDEMEGIAWTWHRADQEARIAPHDIDLQRMSAMPRHAAQRLFFRRAWHPATALRNRSNNTHRSVYSTTISG